MRVIIAAATLCLSAAPALAQESVVVEEPPIGSPPEGIPVGPDGRPDVDFGGDTITVGLGGAYGPDYNGSNDYRPIPGAIVRGRIGGVGFVTRGLRLYVDVGPDLTEDLTLDLGPIAGVRLNRTGSVEDEVVDRLPRRDTAIEIGGFAGLTYKGLTNPFDSLSFRLDYLRDINGAHDDYVITPAIDFNTPLSMTTFVGLGLSAEFVGDEYSGYYYGITPEEALLVPELGGYELDGGLKNWSVSALVGQSLEDNILEGWSIFGTVIYSRLVGDFADSPLVADRGNANQWFFAAGVGYTF